MPQPGRRQLPFLHRNWSVGVAACQAWTPRRVPRDPKNDDPKNDDPKNDDPKNDDPKNDDPKNDDPKNDDPKNDDPKNDDPKNDENDDDKNDDKNDDNPDDNLDEAPGSPTKRRRVDDTVTDRHPEEPAFARLHLAEYPSYARPLTARQQSTAADGLRVQLFNIFHQSTPRLRYTALPAPAPPPPPPKVGSRPTRAASALAAPSPTAGPAASPAASTERSAARFNLTIRELVNDKTLFCNSQKGYLEGYRTSSGFGFARIMLHTFKVQLDQLGTLRRAAADKYVLRIDIESAVAYTGNTETDGPGSWPPLDLLPRSQTGRRGRDLKTSAPTCVLFAESDDFFGRPRVRVPLWLRESAQHRPVVTKFVIDMDVRWATGLVRPPTPEREPSRPSDDAGATSETTPGATPYTIREASAVPHVHGDPLWPLLVEGGGAFKGKPSQRSHAFPMLARGQGAHALRYSVRARQLAANERSVKISYEYDTKRVEINGYVCCLCMAACPDIDQLRAHLLVHLHYEFDYEHRPVARGTSHFFFIAPVDVPRAKSGAVEAPTATVLRLGWPRQPLDLERYLEGDDTWVRARYGSNHGTLFMRRSMVRKQLHQRTRDDYVEVEGQPVLVPFEQSFFDATTKTLLVPGAPLRKTVVDDSWRLQKFRQTIQELSYLTDDEKVFIHAWDCFVTEQGVTNDVYIPRTIVKFAKAHGRCITASVARSMELGKLVALMIACNILSDAQIHAVTAAVNEAWAVAADPTSFEPEPASYLAPKPYVTRGGRDACTVCKSPATGVGSIICRNRHCLARIYHLACLPSPKVNTTIPQYWYCDDCAHLADPAHYNP